MTTLENNSPIAPGTIINGCRVIEEVGAGGMGSVYRAVDESLSRTVAIKIMHQSNAHQLARTRFLREGAAIAKLDHPGIVKIFSFGEYNNRPFFVMEFIDGWSIKGFVGRCRIIHQSAHSAEDLRLSGYLEESMEIADYFRKDPQINPLEDSDYPARVRKLMYSAASALEAAHEQGIIHRDIKSSNILICGDKCTKLVDFGLVKNRDDMELTKADQFMGTLAYAAPEQFMGSRGKVSFLSDIYSFGIVMYELVTLQHPVPGDDPAAIVAAITSGKITAPSAINPHITKEFEAIILKCLALSPSRRYKSAGELAKALIREDSQPTWFSGFTEILKGWFLKETRPVKQPRNILAELEETSGLAHKPDQHKIASLRFLKTARKKFFHNFAVLEALADLKQAYELDPANTDILFLLAFAYNTVGTRSEVRPLIERSEGLINTASEKDLGKFAMTRDIFLNRDYEEGKKKAIRLQQIYRQDQDFQFALFFCLEALGDYSEAIKVGDKLSQMSKKNNIVAVAQSECYFSIMEFDKAIEVLKERIARNPDFHNLHLKCIQAMILSGKLQQAREKAENVLEQNPLNMLMLFYYGRIWAFLGRFDPAFAAFRRAVGLPGDAGLRAFGFYSIYRLLELQKKPDQAIKYLEQARALKPEIAFKSSSELLESVNTHTLKSIKDEMNSPDWFDCVLEFAHRIAANSVDLRSYTIGNYGCTSIFAIKETGQTEHHAIFSNFNLYESEELYAQLWLPEYPKSPFIDEEGNILTSTFYKHEGLHKGGIASITLAEPWKSGCSNHIYCRLDDLPLTITQTNRRFVLPTLPQPACRRQAFLIVLPHNFAYSDFSKQPDERKSYDDCQVLCYYPFLLAGEAFDLEFSIG